MDCWRTDQSVPKTFTRQTQIDNPGGIKADRGSTLHLPRPIHYPNLREPMQCVKNFS